MNNLQNETQKHIISLFVNNKPGVLIRIALAFARRGYNIDNLVTHPTHNSKFSMITIGASGDEKSLALILKQLYKIVDVIHAKDRSRESIVTQELALIKCQLTLENRAEILHVIKSFDGQVVDMSPNSIIFSCVGDSIRLDSITEIFDPYNIVEVIRTGTILMLRGENPTTE